MSLASILILAPLLVGLSLFWVRPAGARRYLVLAAAVLAAAGSIALAALPWSGEGSDPLWTGHASRMVMSLAEAAMALFVIWVGIRNKRPLIVGLMVAQSALMAWLEFSGGGPHASGSLFIDKFSVIMALINGIVGGGICCYALGYMDDFHSAHPEIADRRPMFFGLLFVFLGAMFGIVFADSLVWLFLFWEVTTLCSFVLIGYTGTEEARRNALRALTMNLAGGLAFAGAIVWAVKQAGVSDLQALIRVGPGMAIVPAALLCFAGITKSAQLPFSSWLLGAMVAPTPVSALLHSSTMVKAGVYLVLRMAPVVTGTTVGLLVALVGALTFLVGSLAAITTSNAKKVLAYSTVANLGLIVLCGGIGTPAALWAGVLLLVFHAIAKCLLFLCVGIVEHRFHSRDIESMSGLILSMPRVAVMMLIGMAGMFLAPFGMLISKWAVLKAVVDAYPVLTVFIVFGSAATLFFWVKWMGKLLEVIHPHERIRREYGPTESVALYTLSAATFLTCLFFPLISTRMIEPFVAGIYGQSVSMAPGNIVIMMIMMVMIMLFPMSFINYGRGVKVMDAYLGGANAQSSTRFVGSAQQVQEVALNNYYLRGFLDEAWLTRWGVVSATVLLAVLLMVACL